MFIHEIGEEVAESIRQKRNYKKTQTPRDYANQNKYKNVKTD